MPNIVINQAEVNLTTNARNYWQRRNRQLNGALMQALPVWLQMPVYNSHQNDGFGAIKLLHTQFDVQYASDYATQMTRLISLTINSHRDMTEQALRMQYDHMRTAHAAIILMGQDTQPDSALHGPYLRCTPQSGSSCGRKTMQILLSTFASILLTYELNSPLDKF